MGWTVGRVRYGKNIFLGKDSRVAEWSALQTGDLGGSSSIPAGVKDFFEGIKSLEQYIASSF